ncbi:MAG: DMT family transporter [Afipia sp.]|nr:DMT family transporter [Afipia sp.]
MHIVKAVSFKVASTLMFAIMGAQVRYLAGAYPEGQVAFFRSVFALIPILIVFGWRGQLRGALRTKRPSDHLLRGFFSVVGTFCTMAALARIPIADFTAIAFLAPLITVIFAAIFLKEHVHAYRWSAVAFGFGGVILMLTPYVRDHVALTSAMTIGLLFALTNAFTAGVQKEKFWGGMCLDPDPPPDRKGNHGVLFFFFGGVGVFLFAAGAFLWWGRGGGRGGGGGGGGGGDGGGGGIDILHRQL